MKADDAGLVGRTIRTLRNPGPIARQFSPFLNETADLIARLDRNLTAAEAKLASVRADVEKWLSSDFVQLHAGEMTAQELRSVKAVVTAIAAAIRNQERADG